MTKEDLLEVMKIAQDSAAQSQPKKEEKGVLDRYIEQRNAKEEEDARSQEALRKFYGLDKD